MNIGDRVKILRNAREVMVRQGYNEWLSGNTPLDGVVTYIGPRWATVLVNSVKTGLPIYKESFALSKLEVMG